MKSAAIAVLGSALLSACAMEPYHNEMLPSKTTPVVVQAWALGPGATVEAECRPYLSGGSWTHLSTFTALTSSLVLNGASLYPVTGSMTIPSACWFQWHPNQASVEVRLYQIVNGQPQYFQMFDAAGRKCVFDAVGKGKEPINTALNCQPMPIIVISAP